MSLLTLFRQFARVFHPSTPARGTSVMTSPETVWVVTAPVRDTVHFSEVTLALKLSPNTQHAVTKPKVSAGTI